jgi:hypothetical protein
VRCWTKKVKRTVGTCEECAAEMAAVPPAGETEENDVDAARSEGEKCGE